MNKKRKVTSISLVSKNVKIEGDISGDENFKIDGTINGSVKVSGDILIEETGNVIADISGENIIVKGNVNGNISANHRIEIYATGTVIGDISATSVDIQEGAKFEGRSHMMQSSNPSGEGASVGHKK